MTKPDVIREKRTRTPAVENFSSDRIVVESTEEDTYLVLDGVRMAKRGKPDTPEEGTWIYLKPDSPERQG